MPVSFRPIRAALVALLLAGSPVWAAPPPAPLPIPAPRAAPGPLADSALCTAAIVSAEWAERLPPRLLGAIAAVESGRPDPAGGAPHPWPWTVNAQGQGVFYASKAQAVAAVRALQAQGVASIDVGCLQVNLMYHPDAFTSLDQAFDPTANARFAAKFLTALHTATRDWMAAVAAYHSETPDIAANYRARVLALWQAPDPDGASGPYRAFAPETAQFGAFAGSAKAYGAFAAPESQFGAFAPAPK